MKLGKNEIVNIISTLDLTRDINCNDKIEKDKIKLILKFSKELYKRGYSTLISRTYLKNAGIIKEI